MGIGGHRMSKVEKMYENAGVKPLCQIPDESCGLKNVYEDFTAEKQLELVKWLMVNNKDYQYDVEDNKYWFIIDDYRETKYREFDEALAELINLYWQDLTEQERTEIAEILRG